MRFFDVLTPVQVSAKGCDIYFDFETGRFHFTFKEASIGFMVNLEQSSTNAEFIKYAIHSRSYENEFKDVKTLEDFNKHTV